VYVIGVFDLFHRGHVELLRRAKELGQRLVVAVNGDEMVGSYKRRPIMQEGDRLAVVAACKYVDEAFIINTFDNKPMLEEFAVSAIVHGDDWDRTSYLEQIRVTESFLTERGIELVFLPATAGVSTTGIIQRIRELQ
jgi:glycerol-3-phosphate cytidylyltransferase